jgi:hypothetical protein
MPSEQVLYGEVPLTTRRFCQLWATCHRSVWAIHLSSMGPTVDSAARFCSSAVAAWFCMLAGDGSDFGFSDPRTHELDLCVGHKANETD